jgi:hypothetical protein
MNPTSVQIRKAHKKQHINVQTHESWRRFIHKYKETISPLCSSLALSSDPLYSLYFTFFQFSLSYFSYKI